MRPLITPDNPQQPSTTLNNPQSFFNTLIEHIGMQSMVLISLPITTGVMIGGLFYVLDLWPYLTHFFTVLHEKRLILKPQVTCS
jgi:hypothetical protein